MLTITQVDAFTSEPFGGNPAAVCVLDEPRSERWMQLVAREMNVSETAFVVRGDEAYGYGGSHHPSKSICAGTRRSPAHMCCGRRASNPRIDPRGSRLEAGF